MSGLLGLLGHGARAGMVLLLTAGPLSALERVEKAEEDGGHAQALRRVLDSFAGKPAPMVRETGRPRPAKSSGTDAVRAATGETVRRIVVDAGHGGHDAGATGPTGVREKDVTLAIAKRLAKVLRARGFEVVLTRDDDTYVGLVERTRRANEADGDLFLSVHANAHQSSRKTGIETYALNVATDGYAARLAARENADGGGTGADVAFLLADLAQREFTGASDRLAREVQGSVVRRVVRGFGPTRDLGVKHALFQVLFGARMPAVLVETAFVTNPGEEKRLASSRYQMAVAEAIADGVERFAPRPKKGAAAK